MDSTTAIGLASTIVTALAGAVCFLFKLHYVDTRKSLADCEDRHKSAKEEFEKRIAEERAECTQEMVALKSLISELQQNTIAIQQNANARIQPA